jgi:hypothetical protein
MMPYTTIQALGQARLDDLHEQARRDALARAASRGRRARRARRQRSAHRTPGLLGALVRWARRPAVVIPPGPADNNQTVPFAEPSSITLNDLCTARVGGSMRPGADCR